MARSEYKGWRTIAAAPRVSRSLLQYSVGASEWRHASRRGATCCAANGQWGFWRGALAAEAWDVSVYRRGTSLAGRPRDSFAAPPGWCEASRTHWPDASEAPEDSSWIPMPGWAGLRGF